MTLLTPTEIVQLLQGQSITDEWPWNTDDEATIDKHYKDVLAEVCRKCAVRERTEWGHYGSGYASYIDCWLYRETDEFRWADGDCYNGLIVLFSRLSRYYVLGEGEKSWRSSVASSYLPEFNTVDNMKTPAVFGLVEPVCAVLEARGLVRLWKDQLAEPLPPDARIPELFTILSYPPFLHFDALFHWED